MKLFVTLALLSFQQILTVKSDEKTCLEQEYNTSLKKSEMAKQFSDETASMFVTPMINLFRMKLCQDQLQNNEDVKKEICACALYREITKPGSNTSIAYEAVLKDCQVETKILNKIKLPSGKYLYNFSIMNCRSYNRSLSLLKGERVKAFFKNTYDIYVANTPTNTDNEYEIQNNGPAKKDQKPGGFYLKGILSDLDLNKFVPKEP